MLNLPEDAALEEGGAAGMGLQQRLGCSQRWGGIGVGGSRWFCRQQGPTAARESGQGSGCCPSAVGDRVFSTLVGTITCRRTLMLLL